ncbi:MAG: hypothetical protein Q8P13_04685 [bacterium]|nr:hypothetical protein [bacterium]
MIIKNFSSLATTRIRKTALEIIEAGFEGVRTKDVIKKNVRLEGDLLKIKSETLNLND